MNLIELHLSREHGIPALNNAQSLIVFFDFLSNYKAWGGTLLTLAYSSLELSIRYKIISKLILQFARFPRNQQKRSRRLGLSIATNKRSLTHYSTRTSNSLQYSSPLQTKMAKLTAASNRAVKRPSQAGNDIKIGGGHKLKMCAG